MRERYTGKSRGFGFVTFADAAGAHRAVASEHTIDGRRCEAKFALPEGKVGSARTTRIFVARIPSSVPDAQFRAYFEQFGAVQDAYMPKDPSKQGHRGIGFVTYASADSVERVMARTHVLNGNEIAIDRATPKDRGGVASLPGRLSMSQPNLHLLAAAAAGSSGHGGNALVFLRQNSGLSASPSRYGEYPAGSGGLGSRHMSQPALSSAQSQFGSPPSMGLNPNRPGSAHMGLNTLAGGYPSGTNLNLLAQAQAHAAALQHQLSDGNLAALEGATSHATSQQLIHLINANVAVTAGASSVPPGSGMPPSPSSSSTTPAGYRQVLPRGNVPVNQKPPSGSSPSSKDTLSSSLIPHQHADPMTPHPHGSAVWSGSPPHNNNNNTLNSAVGNGTAGGLQPMGPASARAGPRIFIGKLNRDTGEQDVKDYFSRFGYVLDVYLPRDKTNRRDHRGFGFVTFETEASIGRVVSHGAHHIRGSIVAIDSAVPRQEELLVPIDGGGGQQGQQQQGVVASVGPSRHADDLQPELVQQAFEGLSVDGPGSIA